MQTLQLNSIAQTLNATGVKRVEPIQSLWGGYGELVRVYLHGGQHQSVIVKQIKFPQPTHHPRGWATDLSHQRKLKSYQVEAYWYQHYANTCRANNRVPKCLWLSASSTLNHMTGNKTEINSDEMLLVLEDLAQLGFSVVNSHSSPSIIQACLTWLAHFHAQFMQHSAEGLWPIGTYWHLATRPDEFKALADSRLKQAASALDERLNTCRYQTLVHGDAKLANFCFTPDASKAAAVDFQYIGRGCGMKDVAYFLSSVLTFNAPVSQTNTLVEYYLAYYFATLKQSLKQQQPSIDANALIQTWRPLFSIAWADFHRFIKGWSPEHPKINAYSEALTAQALKQLNE
ncbi:phosphotransferase [Shewanella aestuarii]|uniref:Phosphotransferase n=1 Tax=Shewanella aestuarii TaxID=1028752 RepID=A0A6G9QHS3_9GAMM|nr:phosphotransferase [Shewanella aestuarii]QIR13429.1 phosphotransferase [Shewanella aestuarii]